MLNRFIAAAFTATMLLTGATKASAEFPQKPVEMTVLFGGTANTTAQLLASLMSETLGGAVVPISRTGGGGAVGYAFVQGTRPDGYNIVWNSNSISTTHHLGTLPFDFTAFDPIARVSIEVPALGVNMDKGWKSLADMKAAADQMNGKLKVGISGKGSFTHLTSAALFEAMGIADKVVYISYGDGKAPVELLAGRIDAAIQWPGQFKSYVDSGDISVLAVTSPERVDILPDVPTALEQDVNVDISMWRGLAAPKGTPEDVLAKLEEAAKAAVEMPQFIEASGNIGFEPAFLGAEDFGALIAKDDAFYAELLAKLGMAN